MKVWAGAGPGVLGWRGAGPSWAWVVAGLCALAWGVAGCWRAARGCVARGAACPPAAVLLALVPALAAAWLRLPS